MRNWIQLGVFALTIAVGVQFLVYVTQAAGDGPITVERPAGVEGFLPIGALMGWKLYAFTGMWDPIHPAAMVILGFAMGISLLFRKSFCGWFCPIGTLSEWVWKLGRRIFGRNFRLPTWLDYLLRSLKYVLLGFFVFAVSSMNVQATAGFITGDYYKLSDVKMLHFFTRMSLLTGGVLAVLTLLSLLVQNFWCRYLCPYGALTGLLAMVSPTAVSRDAESCIGCGRCDRACANRLPVQTQLRVYSPECSGCMECTRACPVEGTLKMRTAGVRRPWTALAMGLAVAGIFVGAVYTAKISGHWRSRVPETEFRMLLKHIDSPRIAHPPFRSN